MKIKPQTQSPHNINRFSRSNFFSRETSNQFLSLLPKSDWVRKPGNFVVRNWRAHDWFYSRSKFPLSDTEILKSIAGVSFNGQIYGCKFDKTSRYAVLDIDINSPYHNQEAVKELKELLKEISIYETIVYRSSESGGWQVYIPFDEEIDSKTINTGISNLLREYDYQLENGKLEVYPALKNGQALRIPMQAEWAFLNQETLEVIQTVEQMCPNQALEWFISDMFDAQNSAQNFLLRISSYCEAQPGRYSTQQPNQRDAKQTLESRDFFHTHVNPDWFGPTPKKFNSDRWLSGRKHYVSGLNAPSTRSEYLSDVEFYLFWGDAGLGIPMSGYDNPEFRYELMRNWIESHHNGFSQEFLTHPDRVFEHIKRMCFWVPPGRRGAEIPKSDSTRSKQIASAQRKTQQILDKIRSAVDLLKDVGVESLSKFMRIVGCAKSTLLKYRSEWDFLRVIYKVKRGQSCQKNEPGPQEEINSQNTTKPKTGFGQQSKTTSEACLWESFRGLFAKCSTPTPPCRKPWETMTPDGLPGALRRVRPSANGLPQMKFWINQLCSSPLGPLKPIRKNGNSLLASPLNSSISSVRVSTPSYINWQPISKLALNPVPRFRKLQSGKNTSTLFGINLLGFAARSSPNEYYASQNSSHILGERKRRGRKRSDVACGASLGPPGMQRQRTQGNGKKGLPKLTSFLLRKAPV